ncbi:MAG TPA: hypothetical protein VFM13_01485, partial [Gaiellaceae bacterium]|nr:hypothetical protein [Gaiellaceae bacterium]
ITVADLAIDRAARRVLVSGVPVVLAAKEYDLLVKLAGDPTRVFTKEESACARYGDSGPWVASGACSPTELAGAA